MNVTHAEAEPEKYCDCDDEAMDDDDSTDDAQVLRQLSIPLVVFSVFAMIIMVVMVLLYLTKRLRTVPQAATEDDNDAETTLQRLIELIYWTKVQETKAALVEATIEDPDARCAVCLDALRSSEILARPPDCQHVYHRDCISKWIDHKRNLLDDNDRIFTCPLCSVPILAANKKNYSPDSLDQENNHHRRQLPANDESKEEQHHSTVLENSDDLT